MEGATSGAGMTIAPVGDGRVGTAPHPQDVCVVGAGYVGLTAAACLAEFGHRVTCVEANPERLTMLRAGRTPIVEPGLDALVERGCSSGRLRFTQDPDVALGDARVALLCVGTPPRADGTPDLRQIGTAARQMVAAAKQRAARTEAGVEGRSSSGPDLVLAVKSTVPPGACEALEIVCADELDGAFPPNDGASTVADRELCVEVVSNPEFLRESRAVGDFFHPDRIVVGSADPATAQLVADLYPPAPHTVLCDRRSAELVKYASNTFLAVKISFANEVAGLCERLGADVRHVLGGVGFDARIGAAFLGAGPGFGGSCLPKDLAGFIEVGASVGHSTPIARAAQAVNRDTVSGLLDKVELLLGDLARVRVGVLGLAFKPGTDDVRDSPAVAIIRGLAARGALVRAYDPLAAVTDLPVEVMDTAYAAAGEAEALIIATGWPEFADLDPARLCALMQGRVVLDAVGILRGPRWQGTGLRLHEVGRGTPTSFHPVVWRPLTWAVAAGAEGTAAGAA
jgi:UDPglucose 6-dehydrogenase